MFVSHSQEDNTQAEWWQSGLAAGTVLLGLLSGLFVVHTLNVAAFGTLAFAQWFATITLPIIGIGAKTTTATGLPITDPRQLVDIQRRETPRIAAGIFYFLWYRQCRTVFLYCLVYLLLAFPLSRVFTTCPPALLLLAGLSSLPLVLSGIVGITLLS